MDSVPTDFFTALSMRLPAKRECVWDSDNREQLSFLFLESLWPSLYGHRMFGSCCRSVSKCRRQNNSPQLS